MNTTPVTIRQDTRGWFVVDGHQVVRWCYTHWGARRAARKWLAVRDYREEVQPVSEEGHPASWHKSGHHPTSRNRGR